MSLTTSLSNALLGLVFKGSSYTPSSNLYLALLGSNGSEISGFGYSRIEITNTFGTPSNGVISNDSQITLPLATSDWSTIQFIAIYDQALGGTQIDVSALTSPITVRAGQTLRFPANSITLSLGPILDGNYFGGSELGAIDWKVVGPDVWEKHEYLREQKLSVVDALTTPAGTYPGSNAFVGGVLLPDGRVFCVPFSSTTARIYDPSNNTLTTPEGTYPGDGAFAGGVLLPDGRVFCVPFNSTTARIYDPSNNTLATPEGTYPGSNAFVGGVLLPDGRVFCVPFSSTTARIYDPSNNTLATPAGTYPGSFAFVGGVLLPDGRVFCVPSSSTTARIYDPLTNSTVTPGGTFPIGSYAGGVLMKDGRVFCVPRNVTTASIFGSLRNYTLPDARVLSAYDNKL